MFAPISAILALLFFSTTLPNGIRLVELPAEGDSVEIIAGYTTGGLKTFASTETARQLTLAVYAAGGAIEPFYDLDRSGLRIRAPRWSVFMFSEPLAGLFKEEGTEGADPSSPDFRAKVEEEIRNALLGPPVEKTPYATDNAFVLMSAAIPSELRERLAAIPRRASKQSAETTLDRLPAERTLRFKSDLPTGAVIFASPLPGVYYRQWYSLLLLDRVIRRVVPRSPATVLPLTLHPYYYRLELTVPAGQFPEPVEENLLQELQRLQFTPVSSQNLEAARQEAVAYLDSKPVREWFASHDIEVRREEGIQWIRSMTSDDMRVAARDLLIANRVIATWPPRVKQSSVAIESLMDEKRATDFADSKDLKPINPSNPRLTFPSHAHGPLSTPLPERLSSGVSVVASTTDAVFLSGGSFIREADAPNYRADRILVLTPASSMDSARQRWSQFKGSNSTETAVPKGPVSAGDLPALLVLKTLLDLKVIQSGWWSDVELRINANEGSSLQIRADERRREQIMSWIKQVAADKPSDADFSFIREVAIHRLEIVQPHLQALIWERDPQGYVHDLEAISSTHVQDIARIYFQ